jgi:hypothetical protein
VPQKADGGHPIAAALQSYTAEIRARRIVTRFLVDGRYRLDCRTVRLSRYRTQITPPDGGDPVIWNRRPKAADGRPVGRPRKRREVADVAQEGLIVGLAGLAKGLMDKRGDPPPRAVEVVVNRTAWWRKLDPAEREKVIAQVLKVTREMGYRRQR